MSFEEALSAVPPDWRLSLLQAADDWAASLTHTWTAWTVMARGETPSEAISAARLRLPEMNAQ